MVREIVNNNTRIDWHVLKGVSLRNNKLHTKESGEVEPEPLRVFRTHSICIPGWCVVGMQCYLWK